MDCFEDGQVDRGWLGRVEKVKFTFQYCSIAGLDGQGGYIRYDFRTGFENDEENADRTGDTSEIETIV